MKQLYIVRHAKSDQSFFGNDFERPLNKRGLSDAPEMAAWLKDKVNRIDIFISSPANRAKTTAQFFAKAFNIDKNEVQFVTALYHAPAEVFYQVVTQIPPAINNAIIFSHNPGITDFINSLTTVRIDNMPTCGIFAIEANTNDWSKFIPATKTFSFFEYPKALF
jgi:phosphohistidine phosphatase